MIWFWLVVAYMAGLLTPPLVTAAHGFIGSLLWQYEKLTRHK
jgi:hypothetical protein